MVEPQHPAEQSTFAQLPSDTRRRQWAGARQLLRELADLPASTATANDAAGKPYLEGDPRAISLSHSGNWVAAAIAPQGHIGVDIEVMRPVNWPGAHYFLHPDETALVLASNDPQLFLAAWCAKESIYKAAHGLDQQLHFKHIHLDLRQFHVPAPELDLSIPIELPAHVAGPVLACGLMVQLVLHPAFVLACTHLAL